MFSALPTIADVHEPRRHFRDVPGADTAVRTAICLLQDTRSPASAPRLEIAPLRSHRVQIDIWPNDWAASLLVTDGRARFRLFSKIDEPGKMAAKSRAPNPTCTPLVKGHLHEYGHRE